MISILACKHYTYNASIPADKQLINIIVIKKKKNFFLFSYQDLIITILLLLLKQNFIFLFLRGNFNKHIHDFYKKRNPFQILIIIFVTLFI